MSKKDVIAAVVAAINKAHGGESLAHRLNDAGAYPEVRRVIPTGIASLDKALGVGGLPFGKLIEVFGPESVGKTTLCKYLAAQCQQHKVYPMLQDTEQSGMAAWDSGLGLDPEQAIGSAPDTMEGVFAQQETAIVKFQALHADCMVLWDSVAATLTKEEVELAWEDEGRRASRARCLARGLPRIVGLLKGESSVCLLYVNQVRANMDAGMYGPKTRSPGGYALRHWAHIRLELTSMGKLMKGALVEGVRTKIRVVKNKVAPPYGESIVHILFHPPRVEDGMPGQVPRTPVKVLA